MNGDKRRFLFVSITGLISDIAWQVAKEAEGEERLPNRRTRSTMMPRSSLYRSMQPSFSRKASPRKCTSKT